MKRVLKIVALGLLLCAPSALVATEKNNTLVMLGDSTTLCAQNPAGAKLTDYVEAYLTKTRHLRVSLINAGVGGDTARGGLARLQTDVLAHDPAVVTISFGLNDTGDQKPDEYVDNLHKIIQTIQKNSHAKILLVTSTPFHNARHAWGEKFRAKGGLDEYMDANLCAQMRTLAQKYNLPICDLHAHFKTAFKKTPALIDALIMPDGVHLTGDGNKAAAEYLAPMIATLLSGPGAGPKTPGSNPVEPAAAP